MADTLESLEIEVKHSASGAAGEIKELTSAIKSLGKALTNVIPNLKVFKDVLGGNAININNNSLTQTADTINNVKNASVGAKNAAKDVSRGIRQLADSAAKSKKPMNTFVDSLKRIAFYRFIRSIIKAITQAFSEGLQNAYLFSQGIATEGHRFSTALDSMSSTGLKMKNQLGSAFISLLALIAPVVNSIISVVTRLADALSQLFAAFTGGTYLKAKDVFKQWGDDAGKGAKALKEWRNQLLSFDEINRLNEPSDGGSGSGSNAVDPMSMFEDTAISGVFTKIKAKIDELKASLDFTMLENALGRLRESFSALAEIIFRGLGWAWDNVLVPFVNWVVESALPAIINYWASQFELLNAILEKLAPVFERFYRDVIKPIADFIGRVFIESIEILTETFESLTRKVENAKSFTDFVQSLDGKEKILIAIASGISAIVLALTVFNIAKTAISAFSTALTLLTNPVTLVIIAIGALVAAAVWLYLNWDEVREKLAVVWDKIKAKFEEGKQELQNDIENIKAYFAGLSAKWEGIKASLAEKWESIKAKFKEGKEELEEDIKKIKEFFQSIKDKWDEVKEAVSTKVTEFTESFTSAKDTVIDFCMGVAWWVQNLWTAISTPIQNIIDGITGIFGWAKSAVEQLNELFKAGGEMDQFAASNEADEGLYAVYPGQYKGKGYASGGFPEDGLFFANHNELVGSFTNGRTAVANNEMITEGIATAVYNAFTSAMGDNPQSVRVYIDGREIRTSQRRLERAWGV